MTINLMTAKALKLAIKNGSTPEDLEQTYNCTEEELKKRISQLYNQGKSKVIQDLFSELVANRKKHHKKAENDHGDDTISVENETEAVQAPIIKTLEELKKEEAILSETLIGLEGTHKALAERRRAYKKRLEELRGKIEEIEKKLEEYHQSFEEYLREANDLAQEMDNLCTPIREKRVALNKLRQEIEDRLTVTLFVYEDGRIEAFETPDFTPNDEGYESLKAELSEREECLDLKVRDIITLARLLVITRDVEKLDLAFENEELEKAFRAIRGE